jgi:HTH-type transcriptional regulator, sugar sensing transcriptional regulator
MASSPIQPHKEELFSTLQSLGLTEYESRAYIGLLSLGITDARTLCSHSGVPSSKIYSIMEKFELLGLIEVQQSKPTRFKAIEPSIGVNRLIKAKEREILSMKDALPLLQSELDTLYSNGINRTEERKPFFNLQFGMRDHIQSHLVHLADARAETLSYFETTCLQGARIYGHKVKQDIVHNIYANKVSSKVLFGVQDPRMIEGFTKGLPESIELKMTKTIHAPFHVIDKKSAIVVVDNPLFGKGRIASLHIIDKNLSKELHDGYKTLWESAKAI